MGILDHFCMYLYLGLDAHINEDSSIRMYIRAKIFPVYFPAHSTHFLQPADNLVIAVFKKHLKNEILKKLVV